jgi:O-antigen/teichoic acid export membrane protein
MSDTKASFFKQSAWMVMATVGGGVGMVLVHNLVRGRCGADAYAEFKALLSSFYVVAAAAGGCWTLFAQQSAAAIDDAATRNVSAAARRVSVAIFWIGILLALLLFATQSKLVALWKLQNPISVWPTMLLAVLTLWVGVVRGLLQGRQNFFGLGWVAILDGIGRFASVAIIVTVFGGLAAGAMTGAVLGCVAALLVGVFALRDFIHAPGGEFRWKPWLRSFFPLAFSAGALQLIQQFDNMFWQAVIPESALETWKIGARFSPAQTVGFGITQFTVPLAMVMLPRIARSSAKGEASDALRLTVLCTAGMGGLAALGCTLFPVLPLQVMFFKTPDNWQAAPLVPWFAWAMVCFTLANVVYSDQFARTRYEGVPVIVGISAAYAATLWLMKGYFLASDPMVAFRTGVQILGGYCLLLLLSGLWFSKKLQRPRA